ncbi:protein LMBR1L isoform X3 [Melopsittacus undulatus]|uniref:protein LMBR1L isoform X3 n=1 Tax=Melopsittacus undulatus TaxID=13146 RepID=UPI00146A22B3|nr:protein LMBR1L isoform X3 [Melopsittacus undulatus]
MASAEQDALALREQLFHERVRECIICTLLFTSLYILCHFIITHFKKHTDFAAEHDDEDAAVNRIALGLCTFTLAVALGAVLLLPFSIISNEASGTWSSSSPICPSSSSCPLPTSSPSPRALQAPRRWVVVSPNPNPVPSHPLTVLPQGIMARVYETSVVLLLLTLLVLGMVWVASAIMGNDAASRQSLYGGCSQGALGLMELQQGRTRPGREKRIPGAAGLTLPCPQTSGNTTCPTSTPASRSLGCCCCCLLVKPWLLEDLDEQLSCTRLEEAAVSRRICSGKASCWLNLNVELLREQLFAIRSKRRKLELRHRASPWQRNLGYPLAMLGLLALTGTSVLIVCFHVLELLLDDAAMPQGIQDASLGQVSFSVFGSFGAALQVILILYLMVSSVVGFYSSPLFTRLLPARQDTPLTKIIGNCVSLLVLSSALPVFSRTLGITWFDLLGDFGRFNWLGNFYIVFLYNMGFAALTTLCLVKRVSWGVQAELIRAFGLHKLPLPTPCSLHLTQPC